MSVIDTLTGIADETKAKLVALRDELAEVGQRDDDVERHRDDENDVPPQSPSVPGPTYPNPNAPEGH